MPGFAKRNWRMGHNHTSAMEPQQTGDRWLKKGRQRKADALTHSEKAMFLQEVWTAVDGCSGTSTEGCKEAPQNAPKGETMCGQYINVVNIRGYILGTGWWGVNRVGPSIKPIDSIALLRSRWLPRQMWIGQKGPLFLLFCIPHLSNETGTNQLHQMGRLSDNQPGIFCENIAWSHPESAYFKLRWAKNPLFASKSAKSLSSPLHLTLIGRGKGCLETLIMFCAFSFCSSFINLHDLIYSRPGLIPRNGHLGT